MKPIHYVVALLLTAQLSCPQPGCAQPVVRFASTLHTGLFLFQNRFVYVDPGPGWRGDYLPRTHEPGVQLAISNGVVIADFVYFGLQTGYVRYAGINGLTACVDVRIDAFRKARLAPFAFLNPGYAHVWNQYDGGTGSVLIDTGVGVRVRLPNRQQLRLSAGGLFMQQIQFTSIKLGYTFTR